MTAIETCPDRACRKRFYPYGYQTQSPWLRLRHRAPRRL